MCACQCVAHHWHVGLAALPVLYVAMRKQHGALQKRLPRSLNHAEHLLHMNSLIWRNQHRMRPTCSQGQHIRAQISDFWSTTENHACSSDGRPAKSCACCLLGCEKPLQQRSFPAAHPTLGATQLGWSLFLLGAVLTTFTSAYSMPVSQSAIADSMSVNQSALGHSMQVSQSAFACSMSFSQSISQSASRPVSQLISHSVSELGQPAIQSVNQPVSQSDSQQLNQ